MLRTGVDINKLLCSTYWSGAAVPIIAAVSHHKACRAYQHAMTPRKDWAASHAKAAQWTMRTDFGPQCVDDVDNLCVVMTAMTYNV